MARGRPRQFDEDEALTGAMVLFWEKGLAAASLDDLAKAMKMNRPSIYNAFGNKEAIYRRSLARFCGQLDKGMQETINAPTPVQVGLTAFFDQAIKVYCGSNPQMGCLMICTAPSEAVSNPEIGKDLKDLISRLDAGLSQRLERALREGEISDVHQPKLTAKLLQATLQTIALRARTGESKASLRKLARYAVKTLVY
ncbi:MAG: TetR/AcrR family transcriptional regulator [Pseudomonadales bacterium]|nr:TetR/AcrR family transcriptional regulator [Pseudomonadales bacterium]MDG1443492.1 TetR/AcrR family transcriptional regulator [Pseudomonadales bacterium]